MPERQHLERLAGTYHALRGLFLLPISLLLAVSALGNERWSIFADDRMFLVAILVAGVSAFTIDWYYRLRFGRVQLSRAAQLRAFGIAVATAPVYLVLSLLLRSRASWSLDLPVNPVAMSMAALFAASYAASVGLRSSHLAVLGLLFVIGALPVWSGSDPSNVGLLLTAVATATLGVLDHRYLVHQFAPRATPSLGGA